MGIWNLQVEVAFAKFLNYQNFILNTEVFFPINLGDKTWTYELTDENFPFNPDNFVEEPIIKTTIGTTPEGSEWAKVNLPSELVGK